MMTKNQIALQVAKERTEQQIRQELSHLWHKVPLSVDEVTSIENRMEILKTALELQKVQ